MSIWAWLFLGLGVSILVYAVFVIALLIAGRRESARALAGFIPDCVVLCGRLLHDPRVPRRKKALLVALVGVHSGRDEPRLQRQPDCPRDRQPPRRPIANCHPSLARKCVVV